MTHPETGESIHGRKGIIGWEDCYVGNTWYENRCPSGYTGGVVDSSPLGSSGNDSLGLQRMRKHITEGTWKPPKKPKENR